MVDNTAAIFSSLKRAYASDLEEKTATVLTLMNLRFSTQYIIQTNPPNLYRFDFLVEVNGRKYLIEVDGKQHFERSTMFHKRDWKFEEQQQADRNKMTLAYQSCFIVVRLHYNLFTRGWSYILYEHLSKAFLSPAVYYFSDTSKYGYLYPALYVAPPIIPSTIIPSTIIPVNTVAVNIMNEITNFEDGEYSDEYLSTESDNTSDDTSDDEDFESSDDSGNEEVNEDYSFSKILTKKMIRTIRTAFWV